MCLLSTSTPMRGETVPHAWHDSTHLVKTWFWIWEFCWELLKPSWFSNLKFCSNINKILKMAPYSSSVEFLSVFERAVNINQDGFLSIRAWDEILPNLIFVRFLCFMIGRLFPSLACHSLHDVSSYSAKYFQS